MTLRYQTNDSLNCIADWKRRKMLLYLVNMYEVDFSTDMENADDIEKVLKIYHELGPKYLIPELIKTDGEVWNNVLAKGCGLY